MNWLTRLYRATLGRRRALYNDLAEEMRQHLEERTEELMREGMSREGASLAARRAFGNPTLIEQRSREIWQWPMLENLLRDIRFSTRLLTKSPGFTLIAILTLTLGIGANTAIFSLLNALLLRPLPVPNSDRLVLLRPPDFLQYAFCAPIFRLLEDRHEVFRDVFTYSTETFQVRENSSNQKAPGSFVSGQYFDGLQARAELGRTLTPADNTNDHDSTGFPAVISDAFWRTHYNHAPNIIGQKLVVNNIPFTVVGVMPASFFGFDVSFRSQLWIPFVAQPLVTPPFDMLHADYHAWFLRIGARLQPGITLPQANAWLRTAMPPITKEAIPSQLFEKKYDNGLPVIAEPGSTGFSYLRLIFRKPLLLIFGFCALLLLLACINLASLLLARAAIRHHEIATRLAIGATRRRIIQQLLVDSLLLSLLGAIAGLCLAPFASHALTAMLTKGHYYQFIDSSVDWRVCLFVASVAVVSTVLVGLVPALQATAGDLNHRMKDGTHVTRSRRLLPKFLLSIEVALAMVLVTAAGLLSTTLFRLNHSGLGFDSHNLLLVYIDTSRQPLQGEALIRFYQSLAEHLGEQHGVVSVSYSHSTPLSGNWWSAGLNRPGGKYHQSDQSSVGPGYFRTMDIPILAGREFNWQDTPDRSTKIILNQSAARALFPSGDAIGQQVEQNIDGKKSVYQVIGIVGNTKYTTLHDSDPPEAYTSITQDASKRPSYTAVLRISGPIAPLASATRNIIAKLSSDIPAPTFMTMDQQIRESVSTSRVMALLSAFFSVIALLVAAIGLYGVLAYSTARRASEIGIRMALGAGRAQVIGLVFRENLWIALAGCAAGLVAAILSSRVLASFLYGTSPRDPWILFAALAVLWLVAALASLIPAVRAASIDPIQALRAE